MKQPCCARRRDAISETGRRGHGRRDARSEEEEERIPCSHHECEDAAASLDGVLRGRTGHRASERPSAAAGTVL